MFYLVYLGIWDSRIRFLYYLLLISSGFFYDQRYILPHQKNFPTISTYGRNNL